MSYLMRVSLRDRPGSLGSLAVALGTVGADILSLDVIERGPGYAVDDLVVDLSPGSLPDALITAAEALDGVTVFSIRPYTGVLDAHKELELIDRVTGAEPTNRIGLLVEGLPRVLRTGWAMVIAADGTTVAHSTAAPETRPKKYPFVPLQEATVFGRDEEWMPVSWIDFATTLAAAPLGRGGSHAAVLVGRPGGPEFRPSEVARIGYLAGILGSVLG